MNDFDEMVDDNGNWLDDDGDDFDDDPPPGPDTDPDTTVARPSTLLGDWNALKALTYDRFIWWLMTRVLHPIASVMLRIAIALTPKEQQ